MEMNCTLKLITTSTDDLCGDIHNELPSGVSIFINDSQFLMLDSDYRSFRRILENFDANIKIVSVSMDIPISQLV